MAITQTPPVRNGCKNSGVASSDWWQNETTKTWWFKNRDTKEPYKGPKGEKGDPATLIFNSVEEMRGITDSEIAGLLNGSYKSVTLLGYYEKGDTPTPIEYFLSNTAEVEDGGSIFEVNGVKIEHEFGTNVHVSYFGLIGDDSFDNTEKYTLLSNYLKDGNIIEFEFGKTYIGNFESTDKSIGVNFNNAVLKPSNPGTGVFVIKGSLGPSINVIGNPVFNDVSITVADASSISVGDVILLRDQSIRPADNLPDQNKEILKVKSISGNTLSFEGNIRGTFMTGQVTIHKINKIENITINGATFIDKDFNEFPILWIRYAENVIVNNVRVYNFFGNGIRLDSVYGGQTTNLYTIKPRAVASGQGYGLAINDSRNIYSNNIHGEGNRHVVDYKCSYDCVLENVYDTDGLSTSVVLAHNGFGGYITVENLFSTANSYAVTVSDQGFSELNKQHQVLRGYRIRNVNHTWKGILSTSTMFGVLIRGNYGEIDIQNITANYDGDTDLTTLNSGASVVRLEGDKKGYVNIDNIQSRVIGSLVLLMNRTGTTTSLMYPTRISNLYAQRAVNILFLRGVGNIQLYNINCNSLEGGVMRLDNLNGLNPNFIDIDGSGLTHAMRANIDLIDTASTISVDSISGKYTEVSSASGTGLTLTAGGIIDRKRIFNSGNLLRITSTANTNITLNTTTPIEKGLWNGQRLTVSFRNSDVAETGTITIPTGSSTVMTDRPIVMKAGNNYDFVYFSGMWRLLNEKPAPNASITVKGLVNQTVALANISTADATQSSVANAVVDTASTATDVAGLLADHNDLVDKYNSAVALLNDLKTKMNALVTLANATKASQNTELTNQRTAGQQAT